MVGNGLPGDIGVVGNMIRFPSLPSGKSSKACFRFVEDGARSRPSVTLLVSDPAYGDSMASRETERSGVLCGPCVLGGLGGRS